MKVTPVLLIILDGFGCSESPDNNAIASAHKPNWDKLWQTCPHTTINASEASVGLPSGQMGNSEVGHLNIGAGRVVYQEFTRINRAISSGNFFANPALTQAVETARSSGKALHILGLLSDGGVHSHETHIHAMLELAARAGVENIYLHAFLDGRDTPPRSAQDYLRRLQEKCDQFKAGRIASIIGRYFVMDRDKRWLRVRAGYDLLTQGKAEFQAESAEAALAAAYARNENDEFVKATAIVPPGTQPVRMEDGDVAVFMNFRSDRAREITRAFIEPGFDLFERELVPHLAAFCTLTEYSKDFNVPVAYPPEQIRNGFGEYISNLGLKQLRIAETEKYAHVTFFFDGGEERIYPGEDRVLVPSPDVPTYDLKPEMSAFEVTDKLVEAIESRQFDAIVCNYANADMVGHTGVMTAAVKAIETLDQCLQRVVEAMQRNGGEVLITADHGNAEMMADENSHQAHTAHTLNRVPLVYVGRKAHLAETGALEDVAPTLLKIMGLQQPAEMTGHPLIEFE
ncbi:2,3-bisphosphoglycerate-independent phosphoglycerate mutase [Sulfuricella sp.]|uniref:2,3-bisphosphoglycerate-independent phosphoglycerate mutase n=1 Tax=Sulfuricella sp. TaxID=2099377 RepID=UPI002CAF1CF0|nr:2,3-bisphosphoglycerate-independent phosphoglycerate mutase [Sulfuricella sp.]HUX62467.1 2,3-bisphosphoglycerate-independent phosphoglycerate mutase [Sulfuricella sp.]